MGVRLMKLKEVRLKACLTGVEVSAKAEIGTTAYWHAEGGKAVSVVTARNIAKALGVNVGELQE